MSASEEGVEGGGLAEEEELREGGGEEGGNLGEGLSRVGGGGEWRPWEIEAGRVRAREGLRNRG